MSLKNYSSLSIDLYAVFTVGRWRMVSSKSVGVVSMMLAISVSSTKECNTQLRKQKQNKNSQNV